jgi:hypothetical protein
MIAVKCQNCGHDNPADDNFCLNCGNSILGRQMPNSYAPLDSVSQPVQPYQSYGFNVPESFRAVPVENEFGRWVYIFYKIFCALVACVSFFWAILGVLAIIGSHDGDSAKEKQDAFNGGVMFITFGLLFFVPYALALFLPRRQWHWFIGIALIAFNLIPLGFSSIFLLPLALILLIFWINPKTKSYLSRT